MPENESSCNPFKHLKYGQYIPQLGFNFPQLERFLDLLRVDITLTIKDYFFMIYGFKWSGTQSTIWVAKEKCLPQKSAKF